VNGGYALVLVIAEQDFGYLESHASENFYQNQLFYVCLAAQYL